MEELKTLWRQLSRTEKAEMANHLETSPAYLSQLAYGHRSPGRHFKRALEAEMAALKKYRKAV